jgi:hypothetical protein
MQHDEYDNFDDERLRSDRAATRSDSAPSVGLDDGDVETLTVRKRWRRRGKCRRTFGSKPEGDGKNIVPTNLEQWWTVQRAVTTPVSGSHSFVRTRERQWLEPLDHRRRRELHVMNPWAGAEFARHLTQAWTERGGEGGAQAVTVIDHAHDWYESRYSDPDPRQVLVARDALAEQVRRAFRGRSYLFILEVALYRTSGSWSWRFCPHLHGIVWADRKWVLGRSDGFSGGFYGAPPIWTTQLRDSGWLAYITKDPRLSYVWWRQQDGEFQARARRCAGREVRLLLQQFQGVTKPELCIASGIGQQILQRARHLAKARGYFIPHREPGNTSLARIA